MSTRFKYPRTVHLPWSEGRGDDDLVNSDLAPFAGREIVITEKMDGENTTLYHDGFHARSIDSRHHPSRDWLANFHSRIAHRIPTDVRICGENVYAKHSIAYNDLPSYFLGFSVWQGSTCYNWSDTLSMFNDLSITPVREVYRGPYDRRLLEGLCRAMDSHNQEGYVVRVTDSFDLEYFQLMVRKYVRANHVTTDKHWAHAAVIPNQLSK